MEEINVQQLALWWIRNVIFIFFSIILIFLLVIVIGTYFVTNIVFNSDTQDKYNLNPHPLCAPASFEGKTVTNCINK